MRIGALFIYTVKRLDTHLSTATLMFLFGALPVLPNPPTPPTFNCFSVNFAPIFLAQYSILWLTGSLFKSYLFRNKALTVVLCIRHLFD